MTLEILGICGFVTLTEGERYERGRSREVQIRNPTSGWGKPASVKGQKAFQAIAKSR